MSHTPTTPQPGPDDEAEVIHLTLLIPPVRRLLAFYDDLLANKEPTIEQLDEAVVELKALPHIPGPLGRDIALIADGGRGATRNDIVGSLERLRQIAAMNPTPTQTRSAQPSTKKRSNDKRPKTVTPQATLPGIT